VQKLIIAAAAALLATSAGLALPPSIPPVDSPALAKLGPHAAGVRTLTVPAGAQQLRVLLWYPASDSQGKPPARYARRLEPAPPSKPLDVTTEALAVADASAVPGRHPLVVLSHGYRGWPESMSHLAENLATKGYVVAGIDHGDLPFADAAGFQRSFGLTAATRASDQQAVIAALTLRRSEVSRSVDPGRIGLIGYSMGGFGALATAGAGYDPTSAAIRALPSGALDDQLDGRRRPEPSLKALVAIAPWGMQPPHRVWSAQGLAKLKVPMLVIAGDQDDVSGYREGILPLFEAATGSQRYMLTYREARHNVGGNPSPTEARGSFALREMFDEPVWRQDRINAINQHFVTAFLDRHLKGDTGRDEYLRRSADGGWPGFQPRWELGFDLRSARQAATPAAGSSRGPSTVDAPAGR
jgi:predicted dienelactone hydrolase